MDFKDKSHSEIETTVHAFKITGINFIFKYENLQVMLVVGPVARELEYQKKSGRTNKQNGRELSSLGAGEVGAGEV